MLYVVKREMQMENRNRNVQIIVRVTEEERQVYSPAWYTVQTVKTNYTLPPAKVLTTRKTITVLQNTKVILEIVLHILSAREWGRTKS